MEAFFGVHRDIGFEKAVQQQCGQEQDVVRQLESILYAGQRERIPLELWPTKEVGHALKGHDEACAFGGDELLPRKSPRNSG